MRDIKIIVHSKINFDTILYISQKNNNFVGKYVISPKHRYMDTTFLYRKMVDKSVLFQGFTIPVKYHQCPFGFTIRKS